MRYQCLRYKKLNVYNIELLNGHVLRDSNPVIFLLYPIGNQLLKERVCSRWIINQKILSLICLVIVFESRSAVSSALYHCLISVQKRSIQKAFSDWLILIKKYVPYLFGYKTGVSPLQNDYK